MANKVLAWLLGCPSDWLTDELAETHVSNMSWEGVEAVKDMCRI